MREATTADLQSCAEAGWFSDHRQRNLPCKYAEAYYRYMVEVRGEPMILIIAFVEGQLAGRVWVDLSPTHPVRFKGEAGVVADLLVVDTVKNNGVATALLNYAERVIQSAGMTYAEIGVGANDSEALARYVRRHYHKAPLYQQAEVWFAFVPPGWLAPVKVQTVRADRYKNAIVVHKVLGAACKPHTLYESQEIADRLIARFRVAE